MEEKTLIEEINNLIGIRKMMLRALTEAVGREPLWEDITDECLERYMTSIKSISKNPSSTITKTKTFFNKFCYMIPSVNFKEILKVQPASKAHDIYLDEEKINKLLNYEPIDNNEKFIKRRFIIMLFTGASLSDADKLNSDNLSLDKSHIFYTNSKGNDISVPVKDCIRDYLDVDYDVLPTYITESNIYNRALRRMFYRASIYSDDTYQRVTFVLATDTFITQLYKKGYDVNEIMQLSGITTRRHVTRRISGYVKRGKLKTFFD